MDNNSDYINEEDLDLTKLKYALYARKSTESESRQVRSIEDQITDCEKLASDMHLNVRAPYIQERKSARSPGKRPQFAQLIDDIEAGRINAIVCWHPDRLCRNMVEGGKLIHLLDTGQLKDIRFYSHQFSNDANGKLLLGMLFVFSYHYSSDLSAKVTQGVRKNIARGISSGTPKHGYTRLSDGHYIPDDENNNFELMKRAWRMRLEGKSLAAIAREINLLGFGRMTRPKTTSKNSNPIPKKIVLTTNILTGCFKDPFYYGRLVQTERIVDMLDFQEGFQPMITEDEYIAVQRLNELKGKRVRLKKRKAYYPLSGIVTCVYCDHAMTAGASKSRSGNRYLYYRCTTQGCIRTKKAIRAKVLFDYIYDFLDTKFNFTDEDYAVYVNKYDNSTERKQRETRTKINSLEGQQRSIKRDMKTRSSGLIKLASETDKETMSIIMEENTAELSRLKEQHKENAKDLERLKSQVDNPEQLRLSYEEFLNLSKNAASKVKSGDVVEKDVVCQLIFLNLKVDEQKVASNTLQPSVEALLATKNNSTGRGERTQTFDLSVPNRARYQLRHTPIGVT